MHPNNLLWGWQAAQAPALAGSAAAAAAAAEQGLSGRGDKPIGDEGSVGNTASFHSSVGLPLHSTALHTARRLSHLTAPQWPTARQGCRQLWLQMQMQEQRLTVKQRSLQSGGLSRASRSASSQTLQLQQEPAPMLAGSRRRKAPPPACSSSKAWA